MTDFATGVDERLATAKVTIDLDALAANWQMLSRLDPRTETGAAVKANGYGVGLEPVTKTLSDAGCHIFFAANASEGIACRRAAPEAEIFVLAGLSEQNAPVYREADLTPVLHSVHDIEIWAGWANRTGLRRPCAIHVDTGMNRLGLTVEEAIAFAEDKKRKFSITPVLIMSHLACADDPDHPMTIVQKTRFEEVLARFPGIRGSLANSAAILQEKGLGYDVTRPGIALYGGEAIRDRTNPMRPVATLEGRILQLRKARKGETVGYGATAALERDSVLAIAGLGYGDGVCRSASGSGVPLRKILPGAKGFVAGREAAMIGRISMDLTAFDVTDVPKAELEKAQWVEFFGQNIPLDDFARAAGTIGYEALTGLSRRAAWFYRSEAKRG